MVWIVPSGDASRLDFAAISDSAIVSGLVFLALRVYSGRPAAEILATEPDYIAGDRPGQAPVADAQQRPGRVARLHPRQRPAGLVSEATAVSRVAVAQPQLPDLLAYRIFAILSYQIVAVTVGWHVYQLTHDPLALGLVGLAEVVPYFCTALFAGYLVDHLPRRKLGDGVRRPGGHRIDPCRDCLGLAADRMARRLSTPRSR